LNILAPGAAASLVLLALSLGLAACTGVNPQTGAAHKIQVDGQTYRIEQITASTWTATPLVVAGHTPPALRLAQAIEKASGCRVTDSSFGQQRAVLSAQVDCGNRLKN
jgi:hypothetical protein